MKAYKALKSDLTTKHGGVRFEIGKRYSTGGKIIPCRNGFHACEKVEDVFCYYTWDSRIFEVELSGDIFEVELSGDIVKNRKLVAARHCTLIREITEEVKNTEGMIFEAVKRNGESIRFVKNPSEEFQLAAVREKPMSIVHIENPTEKVKWAAVMGDGYVLRYIKNPSKELQLEAIIIWKYSIQDIENPSEEIQLESVKRDGFSIGYIKNPSEAVQLAAVKQNKSAIKYIKKPTEAVKNFSDQQFS